MPAPLLQRMRDGSETSSWLNANTKPCPKCSKPVEKNGGWVPRRRSVADGARLPRADERRLPRCGSSLHPLTNAPPAAAPHPARSCNLVLCRCGQAFCWLCGQATGRAHT